MAVSNKRKGAKNWLERIKSKVPRDKEFKKKLIESIDSTGAPLELKSNKILNLRGFKSKEGYYIDYQDGKEVTRQIDIIGYGKLQNVSTPIAGFSLFLKSTVIADCKHYENKALLVFEVPDEEKGNVILRFPVFINGEMLTNHIIGRTMSLDHFQKFFNMNIFSGKIVDVKVSNDGFERLKNKTDQDSDLFHVCEQVMPALSFYYKEYERSVRMNIGNIWNAHFRGQYEQLKVEKTGQGLPENVAIEKSIESIIKDFKPKWLSGGFFTINCFLPLIILDEGVGLVKTIPNKGNEYLIKDLKEVPFCLYLYAPSDANKYTDILGGAYYIPILICNVKHLSKCMKMLEEGIDNLRKEMESVIRSYPKRLVEEIIRYYTSSGPYRNI